MTVPNIEDFTGALDNACRDYLYETIQFKPSAGAYDRLSAFVDYRDMAQSFAGSEAIAQDIRVSILKTDIAAKPVAADRITLSKRAGRIFKPIAVRTDESGTHWEFELKDVTGG